MMYKPLRFFLGIGSVLFLCGALLGVRQLCRLLMRPEPETDMCSP